MKTSQSFAGTMTMVLRILFVLYLLCLPTHARIFMDFRDLTTNTSTDVVFLLDRSSVGAAEPTEQFYGTTKRLAYWMIRYYINVHPNLAQVTIVTYASDVDIVVNSVSQPMSKCQLLKEFKEKVVYKRSHENGQNLQAALETVEAILKNESEFRKQDKKILFLFTKGRHNALPTELIKSLHSSFVRVYYFALESTVNGHTDGRELPTNRGDFILASEMKPLLNKERNTDRLHREPPSLAEDETCEKTCGKNKACYCNSVTGISKCLCNPGFYSMKGRKKCEECPPNTYRPTPGNHACYPCLEDRQVSEKRTECTCKGTAGSFPFCSAKNCFRCGSTRNICPEHDNSINCTTCKPGYRGKSCHKFKNKCENHKCPDGRECLLAVNGYQCLCDWSEDGTFCEQKYKMCGPEACKPGEKCRSKQDRLICKRRASEGICSDHLYYCVGGGAAGAVILFIIVIIIIIMVGKRNPSETLRPPSRDPPRPPPSLIAESMGYRPEQVDPILNPSSNGSACYLTPVMRPLGAPPAYSFNNYGHDHDPAISQIRRGPTSEIPSAPPLPAPSVTSSSVSRPRMGGGPPRRPPPDPGSHQDIHNTGTSSQLQYSALEDRTPPVPSSFAPLVKKPKDNQGNVYENVVNQKGMSEWEFWVECVIDEGRLKDIYLCSLDNQRYISSSKEFMLTSAAIGEVYNVMVARVRDVTLALTPTHTFTVNTNDGSSFTGTGKYYGATGSESRVLVAKKSRQYIILVTGEEGFGEEQCEEEAKFLHQHFVQNGQ